MTSPRNIRFTRRAMLKRTATAAGSVAAPLVVRATALGKDGSTAPSNRITVGSIGVGMMGRGHFRIFAGYPDVQLLALSDVDPWRRNDSSKTLERIYAARQPSGVVSGFKTYSDFRELLDRDDIDAVVIATGERWHPAISVRAARAGKDIYCEKPLSLTIRQARTMAETVRRHNRVFQTGLQQRNCPEYLQAFEMVHAGRIGEVKLAYVSASGVSQYGLLDCYPKNLLDSNVSKTHSVAANHRDWLDCSRTRRRPRADVEIGVCSTILSHLGCIALWTGRALTWDPVREEFQNDGEANALRSRASREPWSV